MKPVIQALEENMASLWIAITRDNLKARRF